MSLVSLQRELQQVERAQSRKASSRFRAETKINDLERKKRLLKRKIEKALKGIERLGNIDMPLSMVRKIERTINQERWMERIIEKRFNSESEHGPGSKKWKALRPSTILRRGSAHPILRDTGVMFEATLGAVRNTFKFRGVNWNVSKIPVSYAKHANKTRPFASSPTDRELKPVVKRAQELARMELRKIARGS